METLLSICIPTYNRGDKLKRLLTFLQHEILDDVEVIVSNNCSVDGTEEILKHFESKCYSWLKINHNKTNIGAIPNMYKLSSLATGKFIWLFGDDDFMKKGTVNEIVKIIKEHENLSYIRLPYIPLDYNGRALYRIDVNKLVKEIPSDISCMLSNKQIAKLLEKNISAMTFMSSSIIRKDAIMVCTKFGNVEASNLIWAAMAMSVGESFFCSEFPVLGGAETTWNNRKYQIWYEHFPRVIKEMSICGLTKKQIKSILDQHFADIIYLECTAENKEFRLSRVCKHLSFKIFFRFVQKFSKSLFNKVKRVILRESIYTEISKEEYGFEND